MSNFVRRLAALSAVACSLIVQESDSSALDLVPMPQLSIVKTGDSTLMSGGGYSVQNSMSRSYLIYKKQGAFGGINLGWGRDKPNNFTIQNQSGSGEIKYDEDVAIKVDGGKWLKYGNRDQGINLNWSDTPVYEWKIRGGSAGDSVKLGQSIKLVNNTNNANVTYCYRVNGAWLKWEKDCSQKDLVAAKTGAPSL